MVQFQYQGFAMTSTHTLLAVCLMAAVAPGASGRGGKAGKGAGGGASRFGPRGISNIGSYEMTWEDIMLAIQLSCMCFGALLALCIVACCAYKICGPAEEEDWGNRYSAIKSPARLPPELLREIYTLPTPESIMPSQQQQPPNKPHGADADPSSPSNTSKARGGNTSSSGGGGGGSRPAEGCPRVTAVSLTESFPPSTTIIPSGVINQTNMANVPLLPNGRARGGPTMVGDGIPLTPPAPPSALHIARLPLNKPPRILSLASMFDGNRPRLLTFSTGGSVNKKFGTSGWGAANRLAAHNQHSSTLDLARAAATGHTVHMPNLSYNSRSLSEPHTAIL